MRAITVRQPWAWAIVHGGKDVENRTRSLGAHRGLIAIHAASKWADTAVWTNAVLSTALNRFGLSRWNASATFFPTGRIIGVVDLVDVHTDGECFDLSVRMLANLYRSDPVAFREFPDSGAGGVIGRARMCSPWAMSDHHHLVLANPRPLARPIPARGFLGLWTVPTDIETTIREQVTA